MPKISSKAMIMPESPIRKLTPFADAAKKSGKEVYHLNIGQPDVLSPKIAMDAVRNHDIDILSYSPSNGLQSYRDKLAVFYKSKNIDITADQIMVTTGGSEALSFTMSTIADADDEIIIPEPFYANYNGFAVQNNVKVVPLTSKIENNFALPPISEFEALITNKTKAILICNPGNPTGYVYTKEEIQQLAKLVIKHNLFLIADEVYSDFIYGDAEHHSILSIPGIEKHAIVADSVSKRYSMCGARIGCILSKNQEVMDAVLKFAQARLSPPTFAQIASEAALDTHPGYFTDVTTTYQERRNILLDGLAKIPGVKTNSPQGAFYCIAELPVADAEDFAQWLLEDYELDGETVMVAPAAGFYSTPGMGSNQIRMAYVLEKDKLERAVEILKHALEAYANR